MEAKQVSGWVGAFVFASPFIGHVEACPLASRPHAWREHSWLMLRDLKANDRYVVENVTVTKTAHAFGRSKSYKIVWMERTVTGDLWIGSQHEQNWLTIHCDRYGLVIKTIEATVGRAVTGANRRDVGRAGCDGVLRRFDCIDWRVTPEHYDLKCGLDHFLAQRGDRVLYVQGSNVRLANLSDSSQSCLVHASACEPEVATTMAACFIGDHRILVLDDSSFFEYETVVHEHGTRTIFCVKVSETINELKSVGMLVPRKRMHRMTVGPTEYLFILPYQGGGRTFINRHPVRHEPFLVNGCVLLENVQPNDGALAVAEHLKNMPIELCRLIGQYVI